MDQYEIKFDGANCVITFGDQLDNAGIRNLASRLPRRHKLTKFERGTDKTVLTYGVAYGQPMTRDEVEKAIKTAGLG